VGPSSEFAIVGNPGHPFSGHGDSGAAIFDIEGNWVGMVFGGNPIAQCDSPVTYITPSKAILESLAEMANRKEEGKWLFEVLE
jgi:hypothetical protein